MWKEMLFSSVCFYRVTVSSNCRLDRLLDYVRNLVDNKLSFLLRKKMLEIFYLNLDLYASPLWDDLPW